METIKEEKKAEYKERHRIAQQKYREKNKDILRAKSKIYRENNKDKIRARNKLWQEKKKVELKAKDNLIEQLIEERNYREERYRALDLEVIKRFGIHL